MKQHQSSIEVRSPAHWILPAALAATVSLHVAGIFLPGISAWGFNIWTEFPHWIGLAAAALCLSLIVLPLFFTRSPDANSGEATELASNRTVLWPIVGLLLFALFFLFRSRAFVYGDGYFAISSSTEPLGNLLRNVHVLTKPLPTVVWRLAVFLLSEQLGLKVELAIAAVNIMAGVAAVGGIWQIVVFLTESHRERLFLLMITLAGGCTALFFGHIEYYVWSQAALVWLIVAGLHAGKSNRKSPMPMLGASAFALSANLLLLPAVGVTVLMALNARRNAQLFAVGKVSLSYRAAFAVLFVVSALIVILLKVVSHAELPFVPIFTEPANPYSVFSWAHVLDMLNLLVLIAPIGTVLLVAVPLTGGRFPFRNDLSPAYIGSVAWVMLIVSFWINPDLGAARDWDLLSFAGIPLSLFGGLLYLRHVQQHRGIFHILPLLSVAGSLLFLITPQVAEKHDLNRAVVRLDRLLWQDPHYQVTYKNADRCMSWASILSRESHRSDLAQKHFFRRLEAAPTDSRCWYDLGVQKFYRGKYDSAALFLKMACQLDTNTVERKILYALTLEELGRHDEVRSILENMDLRSLQAIELLRPLGELLFKENLFAGALVVLHGALQIQPNGFSELIDLGFCFEAAGQSDSAVYYFQKAKAFCPPAKRCALLQTLVVQELTLRDWKSAELTLNEYTIACPNAPDLDQHRRAIAEAKQQTLRRQ